MRAEPGLVVAKCPSETMLTQLQTQTSIGFENETISNWGAASLSVLDGQMKWRRVFVTFCGAATN